MDQDKLIMRDKDILGGMVVFAGTRVPVQTLWDYLEKGRSLDAFLDDFPTVSRIQAQQVLALAGKRRVGEASCIQPVEMLRVQA